MKKSGLFDGVVASLRQALSTGRIASFGGHSVVHFSGLNLLARALATGGETVILKAFENNGFASTPARE